MRRLRILTWHVHGSYLKYLTQGAHDWFLPVKPGLPEGFGGRSGSGWGDNVFDVPAGEVRAGDYDLILYQSHRNWQVDRCELLSATQLHLPQLYLEHDPPRDSPTDTRHPVDDPAVTVVHVTAFNALMWDNGGSPVRVVDHGVADHGALYTGELDRGLVVVNGLARRGRRLGADIVGRAQAALPIDLVGMLSQEAGGIGEIPLADLPAFSARYRFFLHPIRYTSLGLALCEAMMLGLPVVGLATTELPTVIVDGENGFIATDEAALHDAMRRLLADRALAQRIGAAGRKTALARFSLTRFADDWDCVFAEAMATQLERAA